MYYHASPIHGITQLKPRVSNHGTPLIYFSKKRENVLVYLSNAIEKYCRETGFSYDGVWQKWGPYGFDKDGRQRLEEYYPDALLRTYKGVSGYIYRAETIPESDFEVQIPDAAASRVPVDVTGAEFIPDAYEAFLHEQEAGNILLLDYAHFASDPEKFAKKRAWLEKAISEEIRKKAIWKAPDSDCARYYRENYPEIWEHTLEEVIFHGKPEN